MKRKLTKTVVALAVIFSMNLPAYAAAPCAPNGSDCGSAILWELLCQNLCGAPCGEAGACDTEELLNTLLGRFLTNATLPTAPAAQQPAQPEQPARPEQPADAALSVHAYEKEVVRLVNLEREKAGLAALTLDTALTRTARLKSQDMHDRGYFDHNSPTYGTPFQLMKAQGVSYRTAGENIAMGYRTPEAVVAAWMNSPGHRANILNASYTKIGVGYVSDGSYWTQHFTG